MSDQYPPSQDPQQGQPYPPQGQPYAPQGQPYPQYQGQPGAGAPPAPPRPSSIANAVKLMYAGAALSALGVLVGLLTVGGLKDDIEESVRAEDPNASQDVIDAAFTFSLALVFVMGALGVALWLWMAWKNGQGRSWARVVATVLGGLNVVFTLLSLGQPGLSGLAVVVNLLSVVLAVVILVLLWKKESTAFYEGVTRSRQLY
ncbi:hypothetical protein [Nocardioides solisilvae]|uniref:hypothetical protein n=1 Tax=Nocardioides solisilvae TaxID=1542435 RepID=UPI0013A5AC6F|nr:hypothetical protein [Nocardioides solisilvae]